MSSRGMLLLALAGLAMLYPLWSLQAGRSALVALLLASGPLLCGVGVALRRRMAGLIAGMLALLWFSHGVMAAWSSAMDRPYAIGVVLLSVVAVVAASLPGLRARAAQRRAARGL